MHDHFELREKLKPRLRRKTASSSYAIRTVGWQRIGTWLARGTSDIVACRGRSLVFGLCYVGMGHAIVRAHSRDWAWLTGFTAAFLFLGPLLAVGIYELSRQQERGEPADLIVSMFAWCRNPRGLCVHAALLCVLLTLWLQVSWTLLDRSAPTLESSAAVIPSALWWMVWCVFSLLAFVSSVVAVPMLLDRLVAAPVAIGASIVCCVTNAKTMGSWALAVASVIGASLWLDFWLLLLTGPLIGHATWHVYRDCVASSLVQDTDENTRV